jgi:hypothetical protein
MRRIGLAIVLAAVAACGSRSAPVSSAPEPDPIAVRSMSRFVLAADDGDRMIERALDRLLAAPEVSAAGDRLLARLGEAQMLQPSYEAFLGELLGSPAFMGVVAKVALSQPGAGPEAVAESLMTRVQAALQGPVFDTAVDDALDRLFDEPVIDAAIDRFAADLVDRSGAEDAIAQMLVDWRPDLEAAIGVSMAAPSFPDALSAWLSEPTRTAAMERVIAVRMAEDPRLVQAIAALVDSPRFFEITAARLREILETSGFRTDAVSVLAALIDDGEAAALEASVEHLLLRPEIAAAIAGWFRDLGELTETHTLARAFGQVFADPATRAELHRALIGVPRGKTV